MTLAKKLSGLEIVLGLIICGLLIFFQVLKNDQDHSIEMDRILLPTQVPIPSIRIRNRDRAQNKANALIFHGFQCNKAMLIQLGKSLAKSQITSYLIDLPGHGQSSVPYTEKGRYETARKALDHLLTIEGIDYDNIALIGHSMGAMVALRLGVEDPRLQSHILLGPGYQPGATPALPKNLLILQAEKDPPLIKTAVTRILLDAVEDSSAAKLRLTSGNFAEQNARSSDIIRRSGHLSLVYSEKTFQRTKAWIFSTLEGLDPQLVAHTGRKSVTSSVSALLIALIACSILIVPLCATLGSKHDIASLFPTSSLSSGLCIMFAAWGFASLVLLHFVPLAFLRLMEAEEIASLLMLTWIGAVPLIWLFLGSKIKLPSFAEFLKSAGPALLSLLILYFAACIFADQEFYHFSFSGRAFRLLHFSIIFLLILPFFIITEGVFRGIQCSHSGFWLGLLGSLFIAAIYYGVFYSPFLLFDLPLQRFYGLMLSLILYLQIMSSLIYHYAKNSLTTAVLHALLISWILSVGFIFY